jgi:hypothetical protein
MHSRLFGLFLVVVLYAAGAGAVMLLFGVACFAVVVLLGFPIVLFTLADHLWTEHRIREQGHGRGFAVMPADKRESQGRGQ